MTLVNGDILQKREHHRISVQLIKGTNIAMDEERKETIPGFIPYMESPEVFRDNKWVWYGCLTFCAFVSLSMFLIIAKAFTILERGESPYELVFSVFVVSFITVGVFIPILRFPIEFLISIQGIIAKRRYGKPTVIPWDFISKVKYYSWKAEIELSEAINSDVDKLKVISLDGSVIELTTSVRGFNRVKEILGEQADKLGFDFETHGRVSGF